MTTQGNDGVASTSREFPEASADPVGVTADGEQTDKERRVALRLLEERRLELLDEQERMKWRVGIALAASPPLVWLVWLATQPWESLVLGMFGLAVWKGLEARNRIEEIRDRELPRLEP